MIPPAQPTGESEMGCVRHVISATCFPLPLEMLILVPLIAEND